MTPSEQAAMENLEQQRDDYKATLRAVYQVLDRKPYTAEADGDGSHRRLSEVVTLLRERHPRDFKNQFTKRSDR